MLHMVSGLLVSGVAAIAKQESDVGTGWDKQACKRAAEKPIHCRG